MSILVVGSVAYDTVITPTGSRQDALGGSATYFAISGGRFSQIHLLAVVGEDFKDDHVTLLRHHQLDLTGLTTSSGKTFRWSGEYHKDDVNSRTTLDTQLNVFADFKPELSESHAHLPYLFLANIDPELQISVLAQMKERPKLVAADTMNFWIDGKRDALTEGERPFQPLIGRKHVELDRVLAVEAELRERDIEFTGEPPIIARIGLKIGIEHRRPLQEPGMLARARREP